MNLCFGLNSRRQKVAVSFLPCCLPLFNDSFGINQQYLGEFTCVNSHKCHKRWNMVVVLEERVEMCVFYGQEGEWGGVNAGEGMVHHGGNPGAGAIGG